MTQTKQINKLAFQKIHKIIVDEMSTGRIHVKRGEVCETGEWLKGCDPGGLSVCVIP